MMKFSKKSQYGLVAMIYLAEAFKDKGRFCSLREISNARNISFSYLEKILLVLEENNLIESKKGVKGGYRLNNHPQEIKIGDIVNALEGTTNIISCINGKCSKMDTCKAVDVWKKVQKVLDKTLNSITLNSLIKNEK